jgi:hypothetical protein
MSLLAHKRLRSTLDYGSFRIEGVASFVPPVSSIGFNQAQDRQKSNDKAKNR